MATPPEVTETAGSSLAGGVMVQPFSWFARWAEMDPAGIRACRLTITVLLASYFLRPADWMQVVWLAIALPFAFTVLPRQTLWRKLTNDPFTRLGAHFLCWMTFSSFLAQSVSTYVDAQQAMSWTFGSVLLAGFALAIWQAASDLPRLEQSGWWIGMAAAFAALCSMLVFYLMLPGHVFGERLCNWFVYGGLNPVCTGLTLGFSSMWLASIRAKLTSVTDRHLATAAIIILLIAVFFTRSRGAVLALIVAHAVLLTVQGFRRNRTPLAIFVTIGLLFQFSGPLVTHISHQQTHLRSHHVAAADPVELQAYRNPARELIDRGDNGRFQVYRAAVTTLEGPRQWLLGIGQWGTEGLWRPLTTWNPEHLHSAFLATLVHGGVIAFGLLIALLSIGLARAAALARQGHGTWLILLAFGITGLLFDGQTFSCLTSIPKMEVLLVTFPLTAAAAGFAHGKPFVSESLPEK